MPTVVNRKTHELEVVGCCEWSWPDHPQGMSDAEARIRVERSDPRIGPATEHGRIDERTLASRYGELLEAGETRVQQTTHRGDNLPRTVEGQLLGIKQEIATDVAETRHNWPAEVYDTRREVVKYPGPTPAADWGAANRDGMSTWVPLNDRAEDENMAIVAARALEGAPDSLAASDVAWCKNLHLNDDGAVWREAVGRGRAVTGNPEDLLKCAERKPRELDISVEDGRTSYETEQYGPTVIVLYVPDRGGDEAAQARDRLYAVARGTLCTEFGPPTSREEKALDALAASLAASRGTNGAGLGWDPPEPDLLREAGRELQRDPDRLQDLANRVAAVERELYPPWPSRELTLEREPDREPTGDDREPLDRERGRYRHDVERWVQEAERDRGHRRPRKDREPDKERKLEIELPGRDPNPEPTELPGRDWRGPEHEPPAPERAPTPNREIPREHEHDRGGPAR